MVARRFARFEVLIFGNRLGCARKSKANCFLTHRTGRELLLGDEGHFMFAAVLFMPDEVEAGFRHYFPGLEVFV